MEQPEPKWVFRLWSQQFSEETNKEPVSSDNNSILTPTSSSLSNLESPKLPRNFNTYSPGQQKRKIQVVTPSASPEVKTSRLSKSDKVNNRDDNSRYNTFTERPKKKSQKYKVALLSDLSVSVTPFLIQALGLPSSVDLNPRAQKILRIPNYVIEITTLKAQASNIDKEIKKIEGFVLIFEYNNPSSLKELDQCVERIAKIKKTRIVPIVIVGIKSSMVESIVTEEEAQQRARQLGYPIINIDSDQEGNARDVFTRLSRILDNHNSVEPPKIEQPKKEATQKQSLFRRATSMRIRLGKGNSIVV